MLSRILSLLSEIAAAVSRLERAVAPPGPQGVNPDAWVGLRPDSALTYSRAVQDFMRWAETKSLMLEFPTEIDRAVVQYARENRLSRGKLETLSSALMRGLPGLRGKMVWTQSTIKNMLKWSPPVHKVPMMRFVAIAVGHLMAINGWARAGGLLILQVCLGLRPGELLGLMREDLVPGRPGVNNGNAVVALGKRFGTKAGRPQFVVVHAGEDPVALALVAAFVASTPNGSPLSSLSYQDYSKVLHRTLRQMRLGDIGYTPHSPRAGWATGLRLSGVPFTEIQERGRWATAATLRTYLDAVAASTSLLQRTQTLWEFAQYIEEDFSARFPWWR